MMMATTLRHLDQLLHTVERGRALNVDNEGRLPVRLYGPDGQPLFTEQNPAHVKGEVTLTRSIIVDSFGGDAPLVRHYVTPKTALGIINNGETELFIDVGGLTIPVPGHTEFADEFAPFERVVISANGPYHVVTKSHDVDAATRTVVAFDTFRRPDGPLSQSDSGHIWTPFPNVSGWEIVDNTARFNGSDATNAKIVIDSGISDFVMAVVIKKVTRGSRVCCFRTDFDASQSSRMWDVRVNSDGRYELWKADNTRVATGSSLARDGDEVTVIAVADSISVHVNGVLDLSAVDDYNMSCTKHGLALTYRFGVAERPRWGNFSVAEVNG